MNVGFASPPGQPAGGSTGDCRWTGHSGRRTGRQELAVAALVSGPTVAQGRRAVLAVRPLAAVRVGELAAPRPPQLPPLPLVPGVVPQPPQRRLCRLRAANKAPLNWRNRRHGQWPFGRPFLVKIARLGGV